MYISFYLQWDVGSSPPVERWCILLSSSSVVRRCISPSTSSGTLVVHLQWYGGVFFFSTFSGTLVCVIISGTGVFFFSCHQWYGCISFLPSVGRWYVLSSVVRWY